MEDAKAAQRTLEVFRSFDANGQGVIAKSDLLDVLKQMRADDQAVKTISSIPFDSIDYGILLRWLYDCSSGGYAVFVFFEVKKEFLAEFHKLMAVDARETRKEPGCLRFDLLQVAESDTKFCLYEVYQNEIAAKEHGKTGHYKQWNEFKTTKGGTVEGSYNKVTANPIDFQLFAKRERSAFGLEAYFVVFVSFEVKKEFLAEFHKLMAVDARETRKEPGCLRFDLLQVADSDTKFCLYEVYQNEIAAKEHGKTDHYKQWNEFKTTKGGTVEGSYKKVIISPLDFHG